MIVVSEKGEIWSPHKAPENNAPNVGFKREKRVSWVDTVVTIGIAIGRSTPNVVHDEPVEIAITNAIIKKPTGIYSIEAKF